MKKLFLGIGLSLVLAGIVACTQGGTQSTPTSIDNASLTAVSAESKNPVKICHHNPDLDDYMPEWFVIEVSNNNRAVSQHCDNHDDFKQGGGSGCGSCNINYLEVGSDCGFCATL